MDTLGIAASGMRSAELRLRASAHNVANLTTESFRPVRVNQEAVASGGSMARFERAETPAPVDLIHEFLEQSRASLQFNASLRVFGVESQLRGRLTDLFA